MDLHNVTFRRAVRGYEPEGVDRLLERVRAGYEQMWRERYDFELQVRQLDEELARYREDDHLMREILVSARREADETRADAEVQGETILWEARRQADEIVEDARRGAEARLAEAEARAAQLASEARRLEDLHKEMRAGYRAFLLAALELLERHGGEAEPPEHAREAAAATQPNGSPADDLRKAVVAAKTVK